MSDHAIITVQQLLTSCTFSSLATRAISNLLEVKTFLLPNRMGSKSMNMNSFFFFVHSDIS